MSIPFCSGPSDREELKGAGYQRTWILLQHFHALGIILHPVEDLLAERLPHPFHRFKGSRVAGQRTDLFAAEGTLSVIYN